ncbi:NAD(P)-dependent alcohol dehydrogenase [Amycolatopsis sp. NPDC006131]|uniref:NAD(P)-dependent alcohol dehydrogenase n=1 Tax=Amycolatopsis sp. NPDC006131 TaxID=3156731 RepID=UPI0033A246A9
MKAIVQDRYGSPDVLSLQETDQPRPSAGEVLVRVRAAAVNAYDWHIMRGDPYVLRLAARSLRGPRFRIRGRDVAGVVDAVGDGVTGLSPGDEVYGDTGESDGAFAEYVCVPAERLAPKPAKLTFERAAAVPLAGSTALVGLRDAGRLRAGQHVLINGASGGVGTFAVQIAKALGATVTAVCSTRNVELVTSLGADHVVDYTREDFTRGASRYELVLDLVGNRSLADLRRVLTPEGTLLLSGGGVSRGGSVFGPMGLITRGRLASRFTRQRIADFSGSSNRELLTALSELIEAGRVEPVIDRDFPLEKTAEAIRYLETEHARAKVVITL